MGRPLLPQGKRKGRITPIRFTDAEYNKYKKLAAKAHLTLGEWVRAVLAEKGNK